MKKIVLPYAKAFWFFIASLVVLVSFFIYSAPEAVASFEKHLGHTTLIEPSEVAKRLSAYKQILRSEIPNQIATTELGL